MEKKLQREEKAECLEVIPLNGVGLSCWDPLRGLSQDAGVADLKIGHYTRREPKAAA
jgi:hypothetical protein